MIRRSVHVVAALAAAGALLLTACGGEDGGESGKSDEISGADKKDDKSPAPDQPSAGSGAADRPRIELPADLKYTFTPTKTGDKAKDAVLRDNAEFIKATDLAIARSDPDDSAYRFYSDGLAAAGTEKWIKEYVEYGDRTTGTLRVFKRDVTLGKDGTANLVYCTDESKAFNKDLKTGKVDVTPVTKDSYVIYNTSLRKNAEGVWVTERMISERGAAQCQS